MHVARHCEGGRILTPARSVRLGILPRNSHRLNELHSIRAKFGMHARGPLGGMGVGVGVGVGTLANFSRSRHTR